MSGRVLPSFQIVPPGTVRMLCSCGRVFSTKSTKFQQVMCCGRVFEMRALLPTEPVTHVNTYARRVA